MAQLFYKELYSHQRGESQWLYQILGVTGLKQCGFFNVNFGKKLGIDYNPSCTSLPLIHHSNWKKTLKQMVYKKFRGHTEDTGIYAVNSYKQYVVWLSCEKYIFGGKCYLIKVKIRQIIN